MIWDSYVWKNELKREIKRFKKIILFHNLPTSHTEDYYWLRIERFFFVTFYIIRKLVEAKKLSDEIEGNKIIITKYPRIDKNDTLDFMNNHHYERFYDLQKPENQTVNLIKLCNLFIHSFVFQPVFKESAKGMMLIGVFINSDRSKGKGLFYIEIEGLFKLFKEISKDVVISATFNRDTGLYKKSNKIINH